MALLLSRTTSWIYAHVWQVEHQQVVAGRGAADALPGPGRELQVVCCSPAAEHHPVKALVVPELVQHVESEAVAIERDHCFQVVGRPSDAQVRSGEVDGVVHGPCTEAQRPL